MRPVATGKASQVYYAFSEPIFWQRAQRPGDLIEEIRQCHSNKGSSYRYKNFFHNFMCIGKLSYFDLNLIWRPDFARSFVVKIIRTTSSLLKLASGLILDTSSHLSAPC